MKTAVVFYSYDGNCAFAAEQMGALVNADLIRLELYDEKRRSGFAKILWGGGMVYSRRNPALKPYTFDPSGYDLIIIGAPVWAGSPAPPLRTFLSQTKITGKKLALFVCHAGGLGKALNKFSALLAGNTITATADFINPARAESGAIQQRITDWVNSINRAA